MKNTIALFAVAGLAAAASAQTASITLTPSSTTVDTSGGDVTISVTVSASGSNGIEGFDVRGTGALNGTGSFTLGAATYAANAALTVNPGAQLAAGSASINPLFWAGSPSIAADGASAPLFSFNVTFAAGSLGEFSLSAVEAGLGPSGFLHFFNAAGFVAQQVNYTAITVNGGRVQLVPAPSSLALLGLGGLAAARRRR